MHRNHKTVPIPCACTTLRKASRVLSRCYDHALADRGISAAQLAVLRCADRHTGHPLVRMADELAMDRTSLYRALAPLERRGWIKLRTLSDRRARSARLTPKGRRIVESADVPWREIQCAVVERYGRAAWRALVSALDELLACVPENQREGKSDHAGR